MQLTLELGARCHFHLLIVLHFTYEGQTGADVVCSCTVIREALCNGSKNLEQTSSVKSILGGGWAIRLGQ